MEKKELLRLSYVEYLVKRICEEQKKKGIMENYPVGQEAKEMFILNNLNYLVKSVSRYGEQKCYLPIDIKKMLALILAPDSRMDHVVEKGFDSDNTPWVKARASFYWNSESVQPDGIGEVIFRPHNIRQNDFLSEKERIELMEPTAIGAAKSRAITDAGIGLQFYYGDIEDPDLISIMNKDLVSKQETSGENPEKETKKAAPVSSPIAAQEPLPKTTKKIDLSELDIDSMLSALDKEAQKENGSVSESKKSEVDNLPESNTPEKSELPPEEPVSEEKKVISDELKRAFEVICDDACGTLKGNALGSIYNKKPRQIIWISKNTQSDEVRKAAQCIIESDEKLKAYAK